MNYTTTWTLNVSDKISNPLNNVSEKLENATKFGDCLKKLKSIDWQAVELSISRISEKFNSVVETGEKYEKTFYYYRGYR